MQSGVCCSFWCQNLLTHPAAPEIQGNFAALIGEDLIMASCMVFRGKKAYCMFLHVFYMFFTHSFQILQQKIKLQGLPRHVLPAVFQAIYNNLSFGLQGISVLQYPM